MILMLSLGMSYSYTVKVKVYTHTLLACHTYFSFYCVIYVVSGRIKGITGGLLAHSQMTYNVTKCNILYITDTITKTVILLHQYFTHRESYLDKIHWHADTTATQWLDWWHQSCPNFHWLLHQNYLNTSSHHQKKINGGAFKLCYPLPIQCPI